LLLAGAEVYGMGLIGLASILETRTDMAGDGVPVVARGRRIVVLGGLTGGALVLAGGALARIFVSNAEQPTTEAAQAEAVLAVTRDPATPAPAENATAEAVANSNGVKTSVALPPGVSGEITPNERFYLVSKNFNDPRVGADKWSLEVFGLVAQPQRFSYAEILALPTMSQYTTLECISNTLGGKLMSNALWTGVPLAQLLGNLGLQPTAQAIICRSADHYYESFPLELALAPGVLLAHTMTSINSC
jgi:DMSO/TMAO reductase YedYZ molybdopterin-dependent catalytic subunit